MVWLRRIGLVLGGLVVVILLAGAGVYIASEMRFKKKYDVTATALAIPADSASIARGQHLATAIAKCVDCHGENLAGHVLVDDPAFGRLAGSNLTKGAGGIGNTYTDADFVRAIRHGVRPDKSVLLFMPAQEYQFFSDADLAALVAYVKSVPAVDNHPPKTVARMLGRTLFLAGKVPFVPAELIDQAKPAVMTVPSGPTVEYGKYLATVGGCHGCHGADAAGGPVPGSPPEWPPARNLTSVGIGDWTEADFVKSLREGTRPDGKTISAVMPWRYTRFMTDDEIRAVWLYLKTLPPAGKKI